MSGGGGYGPDSSSDYTTPCDKLIFQTTLQSPKPKVISKLKPKDRLEITKEGTQGPVVGVHLKHGTAGSIVDRLAELLRCIDNGHTFEGEVISINGGQVLIRITPS
jgi:hypothetical protein